MGDADLTVAVLRHLKITWESEDTLSTVEGIMSRAAFMLNDLLGADVDYAEASGRDLDLYLNLCLYLYNGMTEPEFMDAYGESLTIARQHHVDPVILDLEETDEDEQTDPGVS